MRQIIPAAQNEFIMVCELYRDGDDGEIVFSAHKHKVIAWAIDPDDDDLIPIPIGPFSSIKASDFEFGNGVASFTFENCDGVLYAELYDGPCNLDSIEKHLRARLKAKEKKEPL